MNSDPVDPVIPDPVIRPVDPDPVGLSRAPVIPDPTISDVGQSDTAVAETWVPSGSGQLSCQQLLRAKYALFADASP